MQIGANYICTNLHALNKAWFKNSFVDTLEFILEWILDFSLYHSICFYHAITSFIPFLLMNFIGKATVHFQFKTDTMQKV